LYCNIIRTVHSHLASHMDPNYVQRLQVGIMTTANDNLRMLTSSGRHLMHSYYSRYIYDIFRISMKFSELDTDLERTLPKSIWPLLLTCWRHVRICGLLKGTFCRRRSGPMIMYLSLFNIYMYRKHLSNSLRSSNHKYYHKRVKIIDLDTLFVTH